jgi:DNA-binding ferritin-like protein
MQEALKNGSVESYSAFKAASDSMNNNMASTSLTDRAKDDAINNLKEHVKVAEEDGDKNAAAAFKAGIESLSKRSQNV